MLTTYLFVPAHDARKVGKALSSDADAVILDLEDGVPEHLKARGRDAAAQVVQQSAGGRPQVWVRINAAQTPHYADDLRAIDWRRADGMAVPKAEEVEAIRALSAVAPRGLVLFLETAIGLARTEALVAAAPIAPRLTLGTWDLALDLGLTAIDDPDESELMWQVRGRMTLDSRRLGLQPPIDAVFARIGDLEGLETRSLRARRLGFGAKLLVHPSQIPVAARVFGVDQAQLAEARELVQAYERAAGDGLGATMFRGQMIDRVHVERARALLARWGDAGVRPPDDSAGRGA